MAQVGRPRALDEVKRREVCALVAAGCGLEWASRYVGCSARTVRREALRNEDFYEQLRRCELAAQLNPLKALQHASGTHWRAAAWLLERTCPERFARPDLKRWDAADIQEIFVSLLEEINDAIPDQALCLRVYQRLSGCFQAKVQEVWAAKSARRDPRRVRQLLERFERPPPPASVSDHRPEAPGDRPVPQQDRDQNRVEIAPPWT
jgi:hypothetical protein